MIPYVIVKLYPGRSKEQKTLLAEEIVKDVAAIAGCQEKSISVAFEEIIPEDWAEKVYRPDILDNRKTYSRSLDTIRLIKFQNFQLRFAWDSWHISKVVDHLAFLVVITGSEYNRWPKTQGRQRIEKNRWTCS